MFVSAAMILGGIWLGLKIFREVQHKGAIDFISAIYATPELDNLTLTPDSPTRIYTPEDYTTLFAEEKHRFKGGGITVYGDWFGQPYEDYYSLKDVQFDHSLNTITLFFDEGLKLEIHNPKHLLETPAFLKIIDADGVSISKKQREYIDYRKENKQIEITANPHTKKSTFNTSLSAPALTILG